LSTLLKDSRIHDFDVYFVRAGRQTYCVDCETVILDQVNDLAAAEGNDVEIFLDRKKAKVTVYTPQHRKLNARIVQWKYCSSVSLAQNRESLRRAQFRTPHEDGMMAPKQAHGRGCIRDC
jgi:hypothetical protein